ncbi:hypothetical protein ACEWY4_007549 [Coilia grayii]|uniref:DDE Tnp4 domain-containing protein n=1 Tax=Coilia grayii TaxID=363190 RepID=A0ABD1KGZ7_9TELE
MGRVSFQRLCGIVEPFMTPEETSVRAPIPVPMRVSIALYKLGSCGEYRLVANQFGVHKSTVKKFVYLFCRGMVDNAMTNLIRIPDYEEAVQISEHFQRAYGLPQVIGCVDGSHIPILPPSDGYRDFINRKGWASYVLQGVVDDHFWSVNCKVPGSAHGANILRQSELFKKADQLPKFWKLMGKVLFCFILGDPAYPLLEWLIKGYTKSPRLTPQQESFNVYLNAARTCVEIAFGGLKARWRILLKCITHSHLI